MKLVINTLVIIFVTQVFSQNLFPEGIVQQNNNPTSDYTLINDYKNLEFDKKNSKISFDFVEEDTPGTIGGLDFRIDFNPNDPENAFLKGTAEVKTIDTDNFLRDGHLMWEKFFYKKKYPKISFTSKQVASFEANTFKVIGDLTIKGQQKEVIITFVLNNKQFVGKTTIYTSDYGVNIHDEREKNKLNIKFHFPILN